MRTSALSCRPERRTFERPARERRGAGETPAARGCRLAAQKMATAVSQDQCGHSFNAREQEANFPAANVMKPIFDKFLGKKSMWCHQVTQAGHMAAFVAERDGVTFTSDEEVRTHSCAHFPMSGIWPIYRPPVDAPALAVQCCVPKCDQRAQQGCHDVFLRDIDTFSLRRFGRSWASPASALGGTRAR